MRQYVALVNSVYEYRTQTEVAILDRYPQSTFTIFDVHSLVSPQDRIKKGRAPKKKRLLC